MQDWMLRLAAHYNRIQRLYPNERLLIVFDIDGTILDMRHLVHRVLRRYDQEHGADFFTDLTPEDIHVHENAITPLLDQRRISKAQSEEILAWYYAHYWTSETMTQAPMPFEGVMPLIRWFQRRHNTHVGLNTGRFESSRWDTLRSLNRLGAPHGVTFQNQLLTMCANGWERSVAESKVFGMRRFRNLGYRVVAMFDNEPNNLAAVDRIDPNQDILLLHADTIFQSSPALLPARSVQGASYDANRVARNAVAAKPTVDVVSLWSGSNSNLENPAAKV